MPESELTHFASENPDVLLLKQAYDRTVSDLSYYIEQCRSSFDDRRCFWPGKTDDLHKHGETAFPWDGASDIEVPLIAEKINTFVSLCMSALRRSNIRAYPVEAGDAGRAKVVSSMLKWMVNTYIRDFTRSMESNANWLFEKGIIVTHVGWIRETIPFLQEINLEQIAQASPELAEVIIGGSDDAYIIDLLKQAYPSLIEKRAKKALKELRKVGFTKLPISIESRNAPIVEALPADGDVFFPPYIIDVQDAPYVFRRFRMTAQQLEQRVINDGWDSDWVDYVIEHFRGKNAGTSPYASGISSSFSKDYGLDNDLIEVIHAYQKLIDEEDGSQGIYCTVFHPDYSGKDDAPPFAKHYLMNGLTEYPFVATRISEQGRCFYDVETFSDLLRGVQFQVKAERDSRIDRASIITMPTMRGPGGRPPPVSGPGRYIPERRKGEYDYLPSPAYSPDSVQVEQVLISQADKLVGLDIESPLAMVKQQNYIDKFLSHVRDVLKMSYKMFQLYGPEEVFFRVTGVSDPQRFNKGDPNEDFDIIVSFDTQNNDPETLEKRLGQIVQLVSMDRNGKFDMDRLIEVAASAIDPVLADSVMQPIEVAQEKVAKDVFEDLTQIFAGIERPARPNGAQIALNIIQQYASQPNISQRLQQDEIFAESLKKYADQYVFIMQQSQNRTIGQIGTKPAEVGGIQTQGI